MPLDPWAECRVVADYHTHTLHSHGRGTVLQNAVVAASRGLEIMAVTDHGPEAWSWIAVDSSRTFDKMRKEADAAERITGVRVLVGAEGNVMSPDGDLDLSPEVLSRLDLVLVGLHLLIWPHDPRRFAAAARLVLPNVRPWKWSARLRERARAVNTKALIEAVRRHRVDIVTHPGLHLPVNTPELARACAARGVRMEISARHHQSGRAYVGAAAAQGANFVLSSDAHHPSQVGDVSRCLAIAKQAGLAPERVWNVSRK
jgi:putative hydrolase